MPRTRLVSITEEGPTITRPPVYRSPFEPHPRDLIVDEDDRAKRFWASMPVGVRIRRRSRSLSRLFRSTFCRNCRRPITKNFSDTSLDIPPYKVKLTSVQTRPAASPRKTRLGHSDQMPGVGKERLMKTKSEIDAENSSSRNQSSEEKIPLHYERRSRLNKPRRSTGAIPKKRALSVPGRLEECKFCPDSCSLGKIVIESSWLPQKFYDMMKDDRVEFEELVAKIPALILERWGCPACCRECRAESTCEPVNEETKSCCGRFVNSDSQLSDIPSPAGNFTTESSTALGAEAEPELKEKRTPLKDAKLNINIKRPPSTPQPRRSLKTYNLSPLAAGVPYERVRETSHGRAFTVSPTRVDDRKTFDYETNVEPSNIPQDEEK